MEQDEKDATSILFARMRMSTKMRRSAAADFGYCL
jgi:hypothetical protein